MAEYFERTFELGKEGLPGNGAVHTTEKSLIKEIECVLKRNQNEKFLRSLLTRALILEKLIR